MKLTIYTLLLSIFAFGSAQAQLNFDITAKGQFNSTWLFNKNISDKGDEQDYAASWGSNYGAGFAVRQGIFSFGIETNWGQHNAQYAGTLVTAYTSKVTLKTFQLPMILRFYNDKGGYFEMGAQLNNIRSATYTYDNGIGNIATNVSDKYAKSYTTAFIGSGVHTRIVKSFPLSLLFGVRMHYGISDAKGVDALGFSLSSPISHPTYNKTRAAALGLNFGLTYTIETK